MARPAVAAAAELPSPHGSPRTPQLSDHDLKLLRQLGELIEVPSRGSIFVQGETGKHFFFVDRGTVRVYYTASNGREVTIGYWHPGDFFGLGGICAEGYRITCAQAFRRCTLLRIPYTALDQITARSPSLALHIIRALSLRLRWVTIMMQAAMTLPVRSRLVHLLLNTGRSRGLHTSEGVLIDEGWTHQAIADMLGCTRQTVTEVLNEFAREGLVRVRRRKIYLVEWVGLETP